MGLADTAKLLASLDLDNRKFNAAVDKSTGKLSSLGTKGVAVGAAIGVGIERLAEKGVGALFGAIRAGEEGLHKLQDVTAQTGAVIESTGGKAGISAKQVRDLAEAQESLTTVDDKVVQSGENMLLTFTNIGKDVFPAATKAIVDMAVAMNGGNTEGIDLKTTAIQVGKALQDPIKGATALRKVGVALTDQQQKEIKANGALTKEQTKHYNALLKSNKTEAARYKAGILQAGLLRSQKIILAELNTEFGKAGEAAGKSGAAGVKRLSDAVEDAQIALATGLAPALDDIRGQLTKALNDPNTQQAIRDLGKWLGDAAKSGVDFAKSIPWGQVADGLKAAAGFAGGLVKAFTNMPPEVQATLIGLAGLNKLSGGAVGSLVGELGKGLIKGVLGMTAGVVNINAATVNGGLGGVGGAAGAAGAAGGMGLLAAGGIAALVLAAALVVGPEVRKFALANGLAGSGPTAGMSQSQEAHFRAVGAPKMDPAALKALNEIDDRTGQTRDRLADVLKATEKNLQPLPEKITAKQKASFDAIRTSAEANRIALVSKAIETTNAARTAGINQVAATRTGDASIVAAIKGIQRPIVNVNISETTRISVYDTGTTITSRYAGKIIPL